MAPVLCGTWRPRGLPALCGRLRRVATVEDPAVVGTILAHQGLLHPPDAPAPLPPSADLRAAAPSHHL